MLERHSQGADVETKPLWAIFVFELWHREFIDGSPTPALLAAA